MEDGDKNQEIESGEAAPVEAEASETAANESPAPAAEEAAESAEAVADAAPEDQSEDEAAPSASEDAAAPAAPAAATPAADKGPVKAKLRELQALRDQALASGDRVGLKRARARIRRLKRQLRRAG